MILNRAFLNSPQEIADAFGIKGTYSLTPDQEKYLRKNNPWVEKNLEGL